VSFPADKASCTHWSDGTLFVAVNLKYLLVQGTFSMGTAFPYLFRPPERRSHGYFEGNVQIPRVRPAMQVMSLTTDYPTIPTISQTYFKLKFLQR
jgi:hypothetical protein